jgi:hypothetical protein
MILIDPHDPRGPRAVALAAQALTAGWPSISAYFMPSASKPSVLYTTTRLFCTCLAFTFAERRAQAERRATHRCYHALAAELVDQVRGERAAF